MIGGQKPPTLNFLSFQSRSETPASPLLFALFIALHPLAVLAFVRLVFRSTWDQQVSAGLGAIVATGLVCNLIFCFGEYFFHRYLLHIESARWLRRLCTSHLAHHKLTSLRFDDATRTVHSAYPISAVAHDDFATFPPWALLIFMAVLTPFFAAIAFSFPTLPILIGGYTALAIAHFSYEAIHVAHHMPYDPWWKKRVEDPRLGGVWRRFYGFHLAHHANYRCNQNVAGFFGLPLADLAFGTYEQTDTLLLHGAPGTKETARKLTPRPRWPISWFDALMLKRRRRMSREHAARLALRAHRT